MNASRVIVILVLRGDNHYLQQQQHTERQSQSRLFPNENETKKDNDFERKD